MPVTPFYRLMWEDGYVFDYSNDDEALFAQIAAKNPKDVAGYKRFLDYSENVFREGYEKLGHEAFLDFGTMMKAAPQLMRYEAFRSVYAMVSRYIEDPQLREAFSFHSLLVGGNPFKTSAIYALIHALEKKWGVWFPRGGTGALVKGMVKLFEDLGGTVDDGQRRQGDPRRGATASPASPPPTAGRASSMRSRRTATSSTPTATCSPTIRAGGRRRAMMKWKSFSPSLFVVYFGLKREHPDIRHHTIVFGNRYRELLDDIYKNGVARRRLLALPPPPDRDRSGDGPAGVQRLLRPVAGAAHGQVQGRLGRSRASSTPTASSTRSRRR